MISSRRPRRAARKLEHGCRAEHGPLVLRIQATSRLNGFVVLVEDPRQDPVTVYEHRELNTLEAAQAHAVKKADEYLIGRQESPEGTPEWRCS
jgi:hypothetical protein